MDAREAFNQPAPESTPEPQPAPVQVQIQPEPAPVAVQPAPEPVQQADPYARIHNETMAALNIIDPSGGLADQVRDIRHQGIEFYPSPQRERQPNGQFAPGQPAEPAIPRYTSEVPVDELINSIKAEVAGTIAQASQSAEYSAIVRTERQAVRSKLDSLTVPRQVFDETTGSPVILPAIPKAELDAAEREAETYGINTGVPGGAARFGKLVMKLWNEARLMRPSSGLPTHPNLAVTKVATPAQGAPSMPTVPIERQALQRKIDAMNAAGGRDARSVFSG